MKPFEETKSKVTRVYAQSGYIISLWRVVRELNIFVFHLLFVTLGSVQVLNKL